MSTTSGQVFTSPVAIPSTGSFARPLSIASARADKANIPG